MIRRDSVRFRLSRFELNFMAPQAHKRLKALWLLFSQACTVSLGVLLALGAIRGEAPFERLRPEMAAANDFSPAVRRAAPAVVTVFARKVVPGQYADELGSDWNSYPELHMTPLGSGVIVNADGGVLTSYHVVADVSSLYVGLTDGRQFEARLTGRDPETDLAYLRVDAKDLPSMEIASSDSLAVGQTVLAIGNPFGVGQTVTSGIISALGRHGLGLNSYEDFIQTDAAINQGNSGGALVDLSGRLIGINSAIFVPEMSEGFVGIGFAIPSRIIEAVLPELEAGRTIVRGYLGFIPRQLSAELAQDLGLAVRDGVMVKQVIEGSPAFEAGLSFFVPRCLNHAHVIYKPGYGEKSGKQRRRSGGPYPQNPEREPTERQDPFRRDGTLGKRTGSEQKLIFNE